MQLAYKRMAVVVLLAAGLAGCASMSEQECRSANWHDRGMRVALDGDPRSRIEDDREACAKIGVVPNEKQYMAGYAVGIRQFCTPENGARWGRDGRYYQDSCPAELQQAFVEAYRDGRRVYDANQRVERLRNEQRNKQSELDRAKDDTTRNRLRGELSDLDRRLRDAREEMDYAERRLRRR